MSLKSMLERFFGRKKEKVENKEPNRRKLLVPNFVEDPEMERVVKEYIEILRERWGYLHDGQTDKVNEADAKAKEIESKYGEKMRTYLKPYYIEGEKTGAFNVPNSERDRWQTANTFKAVDKRASEEKK